MRYSVKIGSTRISRTCNYRTMVWEPCIYILLSLVIKTKCIVLIINSVSSKGETCACTYIVGVCQARPIYIFIMIMCTCFPVQAGGPPPPRSLVSQILYTLTQAQYNAY